MSKGESTTSGTGREKVKGIFAEIVSEYDRVNTVISFGQIGRWRSELVSEMEIPEGGRVLDLGCGTGKLTGLVAAEFSPGKIVGVDLTPDMIERAKRLLAERDGRNNIKFIEGAGENLPQTDGYFDVVTSAFALRNMEDLPRVMSEMARVVKPGGKVYSLELSKPKIPVFRELYYFYFDRVLPFIGKAIQGKMDPYRYLSRSLKRFPDQDKLKQLYQNAGFTKVSYRELFGGIAAIHSGEKREN